MNNPIVSVLMTVYNREGFIAEAIESVLASTLQDFELIIVDDQSTDDSFLIAEQFAEKDKRIRLFRNEINLGDYPNRNKAASYAKGKYIKYLDSDDVIFDWGLEYCIEQMELNPQATLGTFSFKKDIVEACITSKKIIEEHFFINELLNIGPTGTIFRKEAFEQIGFFDTRFGIASDNYVNIKLASKNPVVILPKIFFFYRRHEGQELNNSFYAYLLNNFLLQQALLNENVLPLDAKQKSILKQRLDKNFSKMLLRSLINPVTLKKALPIMKKTGFGLGKIVKTLLKIRI